MKRAFCNEILQPIGSSRRWMESLETVRSLGFEGVEISPFTIGDDPTQMDPAELRSLRLHLEHVGIQCIGFHWLWSTPVGLIGLHPDPSIRRKAWETLRVLARQCAILGGQFLVLGSGKQRSFEGISTLQAKGIFLEELSKTLPVLEETGVSLLIEPLPRSSTNFLNTLEEVVNILKEINSPVLGTLFDFHNTTDELLPWERLIEKFIPWIRHVHFNGMDGSVPSQVDPNYTSLFRTLRERGYKGWVSVELFREFTDPIGVLKRVRNLLEVYEGVGF
ncbi:MAG: sugar phosphate isomerase/epimerase [Spirochaetes bacterium]|nr:sugar phosphate isomerase/epimerase [Spirochaetota bacterium]